MNLDTFTEIVRDRLQAWGDEFALHRDKATLGGPRSAIDSMMKFTGATGMRPLAVDPKALQIEDIVRDIHREYPHVSAVLRAYYCGSGRRSVERYQKAQELAGMRFNRWVYNQYRDCGEDLVWLALKTELLVKKSVAASASIW